MLSTSKYLANMKTHWFMIYLQKNGTYTSERTVTARENLTISLSPWSILPGRDVIKTTNDKTGEGKYNYLHSQHSPPALNCPLRLSSGLTPAPWHSGHSRAPDNWVESIKRMAHRSLCLLRSRSFKNKQLNKGQGSSLPTFLLYPCTESLSATRWYGNLENEYFERRSGAWERHGPLSTWVHGERQLN